MSKTWPVDWPRYKQSSELCDSLVGPCSCGAQHKTGEFTLVDGILYRYGTSASSSAVRISVLDELKREIQQLRVSLAIQDSKKFVDAAVNFLVTARDAHGRRREFNFGNTESVLRIKEAINIVLGSMSMDHLVQTLKGAQDE